MIKHSTDVNGELSKGLIGHLEEKGVIKGYADDLVDNLTISQNRARFALIIYKAKSR